MIGVVSDGGVARREKLIIIRWKGWSERKALPSADKLNNLIKR